MPAAQAAAVQDALFAAGAGHIGNYSECSFSHAGTGTFKGGAGTNPFVGEPGERHGEAEVKLEVIFPAQLEGVVTAALLKAHPYEEVAFDVVKLENRWQEVGSGLIGELPLGKPDNLVPVITQTAIGKLPKSDRVRHPLPHPRRTHASAIISM